MWPVGVMKKIQIGRSIDGYVNKEKPTGSRIFHACAESQRLNVFLIKLCTSTPWGDLVIYLKRHPNCSKGLGGGVRNFAYPIDFTIGF